MNLTAPYGDTIYIRPEKQNDETIWRVFYRDKCFPFHMPNEHEALVVATAMQFGAFTTVEPKPPIIDGRWRRLSDD